MKRGHPYDTDELDRKRTEQRRILRSIPGWLVRRTDQLPIPPTPAVDAEDRVLVETQLRALADEEVAQLDDLLEQFEAALAVEPAFEFVRDGIYNSTVGTAELAARFGGIIDGLMADAEAARVARVSASEDIPGVHRLLVLLAWADALAGDYVDPRIVDAYA